MLLPASAAGLILAFAFTVSRIAANPGRRTDAFLCSLLLGLSLYSGSLAVALGIFADRASLEARTALGGGDVSTYNRTESRCAIIRVYGELIGLGSVATLLLSWAAFRYLRPTTNRWRVLLVAVVFLSLSVGQLLLMLKPLIELF